MSLFNWLSFFLAIGVAVMSSASATADGGHVNDENDTSRMLLVLSAPKKGNSYYHKAYQNILDFQVNYALKAMNKDNIILLGDSHALEFFRKKLPEEILLPMTTEDIWMRDFTPVNGENGPVFFNYSKAAQDGDKYQAKKVQKKFKESLTKLGLSFPSVPYIMDGGLAVMNFEGKIVVTDRFLEDNQLTESKAKEVLKSSLGMKEVAVIASDDPEGLAHTDGMMMFIQENKIILSSYDAPLRDQVRPKLDEAFRGTEIVEIDFEYDPNTPNYDDNYASACGIYVNSVYTNKYIYMPTFNNATQDNKFFNKFVDAAGSEREVIKVAAEGVCSMGGSVRCLTWQIEASPEATKLIQAARLNSHCGHVQLNLILVVMMAIAQFIWL